MKIPQPQNQAPQLPSPTAIQDPATRDFAVAVQAELESIRAAFNPSPLGDTPAIEKEFIADLAVSPARVDVFRARMVSRKGREVEFSDSWREGSFPVGAAVSGTTGGGGETTTQTVIVFSGTAGINSG